MSSCLDAAVMGAALEDLFASFSETAGGCKKIAVRPQVLWVEN